MKGIIFFILTCISIEAMCFEKLEDSYLVTFGDPEAPKTIIEYFSFQCPHCLKIYREDFAEIKAKYIDTRQVFWIFHPIPMDKVTVQAMDCLSKLNQNEKRIFLQSILDCISQDGSAVLYLIKAMEVFEKPIPDLQEKSYISKTDAFQDAFSFIKQEDKITAIPTLEINGRLYLKDIPDFSFVDKKMQEEKLK